MARRGPVLLLTAVLVVLAARPASSASPDDKIDSGLRATLAVGTAPFFVRVRGAADLSAAEAAVSREERGRTVLQQLTATARTSQAGVVALLQARGAAYRPYWIVNVVRVVGDLALAREIAARPDVERIDPERIHPLPDPPAGSGPEGAAAVDWNITTIGADRVWRDFGVTGEGIVVGSIDTGVEFDHPALGRSYRGNLGNGSFAHDYSWWDPTGLCGSEPCDTDGHGTHTMGTMVGGDGPGPFVDDVGVAPGARWIAAKGCEYDYCTDGSLLSAAQFMLAPTDRAGNNPDPSRRPHIVNNSWGTVGGDPFFHDVLVAWRAAAILPVFSAGNDGASCGSIGSPADDALALAVGASTYGDGLAWFSARGPTLDDRVKPDVVAPGYSIRSSFPGDRYGWLDGTSMAAPHVAGAAALLLSANPGLIGNVPATITALRSTALDLGDATCGGDGDGDPNNAFGDGRIDVYAACELYCGALARLTGYVRGAAGGGAIAGATVTVRRRSDGRSTSVTTAADGSYAIPLLFPRGAATGTFEVGASAFGFVSGNVTLDATPDQSVRQNIRLVSLPRHVVSGVVRHATSGLPIAGATVRLLGAPLPAVQSDASGAYAIGGVPDGRYQVEGTATVCDRTRTRNVEVSGADATVELKLREIGDAFGHLCVEEPASWIDSTGFGIYVGSVPRVALPFPFVFYGRLVDAVYPTSQGHLAFHRQYGGANDALPSPLAPNEAVYPFWGDVYGGTVYTETVGEVPDRQFVVVWYGLTIYPAYDTVQVEVSFRERDSSVAFHYRFPYGSGDGRSATIGIENRDGSDALQVGFRQRIVRDGLVVRFVPPPTDSDGDGVVEQLDICPAVADPAQSDRDGDGLGNACDDSDGTLRPTSLQIRRSTSDTRPNGRILLRGEFLVKGPDDSAAVPDGATLRLVDDLQLDQTATWTGSDCRTARSGIVRCRRREAPHHTLELTPLPSDVDGLQVYLVKARLVQLPLAAPFFSPLRVTMTNDGRTPGVGIDRIGTPLDCEARSYGLECLGGREGSTSRAFLLDTAPSLFD